ncbi:4072_t:CDS:1, partial [Scutellospora calospora]
MTYVGNLDPSTIEIHGDWTPKQKRKSHNQIRHVSINGVQYFEMKTQLDDINFIFDIELYNKYSDHTWTSIKRDKNYYLQISIKENSKLRQISYTTLLKENGFSNKF